MSIDDATNYYIALGFMTLSAGSVLFGLSRSSALGLILQACGQDPVEAQALGFNVAKHKLAAFCVSSALFSGLVGGAAGVLPESTASARHRDRNLGRSAGDHRRRAGRTPHHHRRCRAWRHRADRRQGEILRPLGQLSTFVVSAVALLAILFMPAGFLGTLLYRRELA